MQVITHAATAPRVVLPAKWEIAVIGGVGTLEGSVSDSPVRKRAEQTLRSTASVGFRQGFVRRTDLPDENPEQVLDGLGRLSTKAVEPAFVELGGAERTLRGSPSESGPGGVEGDPTRRDESDE